MGEHDERSPQSVTTNTGGLLCKQCGEAMPPPRRKTKYPKQFCTPRCRGRWHSDRRAEQKEAIRANLQLALDGLNSLPKGTPRKKNREPDL